MQQPLPPYQLHDVGGKPIFVVDDHHKVLAAWAHIRGRFEFAPSLLTLDHHTDTHEAFLSHVYHATGGYDRAAMAALAQQIDWHSDASISWAIELLRHDEHIHAATAADIISRAFCIQLSDPFGTASIENEQWRQRRQSSTSFMDPKPTSRPMHYALDPRSIYVLSFDGAINYNGPRDDAHTVLHASQIIESPYLDDQLQRAREITSSSGQQDVLAEPFILDIDLDVFHTLTAMQPNDARLFYDIIRGACAVTIATEEDCVEMLWRDSAPVPTPQAMLASIFSHIAKAMA